MVQRESHAVGGVGSSKTKGKDLRMEAFLKFSCPFYWPIHVFFMMLVCLFSTPSKALALSLAEASGGGALSVGGRGGKVLEVTNLNNSGPGSFRAACEAEGPRIVVFRVGGTIVVKEEPIVIHSPYIAIAGQTAPGDGILLRSDPSMAKPPLLLKDTHDVVIRYLRVMPGPMANPTVRDALGTYIHVHDVVIDHCSLSLATDEINGEFLKVTDPVGAGESEDGPVVRSFVAEPNPAMDPYTRVNFFVQATTGDGGPINWQIDFGDGTHASSQDSVSHVYSKAGTYVAKVTVSDAHGNTVSKVLQVVINDSRPAPVTGLRIGAVSLK